MLYVDDEDDVREVFAAVFEGDFDVATVQNGSDALTLMARDPGFDVLVSDMRMEPMKGAFTGAQASRRGLFELADGGPLFLDELETEILSQVLTRADGNQSRAARSLGLSTLRSRLKRLGLKGP